MSNLGKSVTLKSSSGGGLGGSTGMYLTTKHTIRKLTPLECERLQTLPEGYTDLPGLSKTQRYKMIGNGWTVAVIEHIFKNIP